MAANAFGWAVNDLSIYNTMLTVLNGVCECILQCDFGISIECSNLTRAIKGIGK